MSDDSEIQADETGAEQEPTPPVGQEDGRVRVSFDYVPEDPDPDPENPTGLIEDEFASVVTRLAALGAEEVRVERVL